MVCIIRHPRVRFIAFDAHPSRMAFFARLALGNTSSITLIGVGAPQCTQARQHLFDTIIPTLLDSAPTHCPTVVAGDFYSVFSQQDVSPPSIPLLNERIPALSAFADAWSLKHPSLQDFTVR